MFGYGILIIIILLIGYFILKDLFFGEYLKLEKINSHEYYITHATVMTKDSERIYYMYLCYDSANQYTAVSRANFDVGDIFPVIVKRTKCEEAEIIMYEPCIFSGEETKITKARIVDVWRLSYPHIWFEYFVDKKKYLKCQYFQNKTSLNKIRIGDVIRIKYVIKQPSRAVMY